MLGYKKGDARSDVVGSKGLNKKKKQVKQKEGWLIDEFLAPGLSYFLAVQRGIGLLCISSRWIGLYRTYCCASFNQTRTVVPNELTLFMSWCRSVPMLLFVGCCWYQSARDVYCISHLFLVFLKVDIYITHACFLRYSGSKKWHQRERKRWKNMSGIQIWSQSLS